MTECEPCSSLGGNPAVAWPDQLTVVEALASLELLVQVDVTMSPTAELAHYVVASKMSLEVPSFTRIQDKVALFAAGYLGYAEPWAQYTEATVEPPPGSDLLEEWEFLYGIAQRLDVQLQIESDIPWAKVLPASLDMNVKPTSDAFSTSLRGVPGFRSMRCESTRMGRCFRNLRCSWSRRTPLAPTGSTSPTR